MSPYSILMFVISAEEPTAHNMRNSLYMMSAFIECFCYSLLFFHFFQSTD